MPYRHLIVLLALLLSSCAQQAGQLRAAQLDPLVRVVAADLEPYLDAGIAPDGSPMTADQVARKRGGVVILRNAVHAGMGRELEPLPTFDLEEGDAPGEGAPR
ncbi:MAG: hypothetical protein AAGB93_00515 [Planctomycetota bacterium]